MYRHNSTLHILSHYFSKKHSWVNRMWISQDIALQLEIGNEQFECIATHVGNGVCHSRHIRSGFWIWWGTITSVRSSKACKTETRSPCVLTEWQALQKVYIACWDSPNLSIPLAKSFTQLSTIFVSLRRGRLLDWRTSASKKETSFSAGSVWLNWVVVRECLRFSPPSLVHRLSF